MKGTEVGPPLFENDVEIMLLTCYNDENFLSAFNTAIQAYERGDWVMAKDYFEKAKKIDKDDKPLKTIESFMR